ncbi:MAG: hypothetical protein R3F20_08010 [Planctomycetota bacterium]
MTLTATDTRLELEARFSQAVSESFSLAAGLDAEQIPVESQTRHTERMVSTVATAMGEGWIGSLALLVPAEGADRIARAVLSRGGDERLRGAEIAQAMGDLLARVTLNFGDAFADEESVTMGPPTTVTGDRLSVAFPWSQDFETRLCFRSIPTDFWAVLRLSHHRPV